MGRPTESTFHDVLGDAPFIGFVPVTDLARARAFYVDRLGLRVVDESPLALVLLVGGATLRLAVVDDLRPAAFTVAGWTVDDIERTIDGLVASGVEFRRYPGMDQDERAAWTAPSGDRVAWFGDPDGNTLSLTQPAR